MNNQPGDVWNPLKDCNLTLPFLGAANTSSCKYFRIQNSPHSGAYPGKAFVAVYAISSQSCDASFETPGDRHDQPDFPYHPVIPKENLETWSAAACNTSCSSWELFVLLVEGLPCGSPAVFLWHVVTCLVQAKKLKRLVYHVIFIKLANISEKNILNQFHTDSWNLLLKYSSWVYFQSGYKTLAAGVLFLLMRKEEHQYCCLLIINNCKINLHCCLIWQWMSQRFAGLKDKLLYEFGAKTEHNSWTKRFTLSLSLFWHLRVCAVWFLAAIWMINGNIIP